MRKFVKGWSGFSVAYLVIGMTVILGFASFSVDYARILVAKTELHNAVDAAVRAGVSAVALGPTSVQNQAVAIAAKNTCDGTAVSIDPTQDVEFGSYNATTKVFTAVTGSARSSATAIRITAQRTVARGNPINLLFARIVGFSTKDLTVSSIATITSVRAIYIGLSLTRMYDTSYFDAYNSSVGSYSASSRLQGKLYGNTNLLLANYADVYGEAHWGPNGTLTEDSTVTVTPGPVTQLKTDVTFPSVSLGNVATVNNNAQLSSTYYSKNAINLASNKGTVTAPGGTYYLTSLSIGSGSTLLFSGPTTIYMNGDSQIQGTIAPSSYLPGNLSINVYSGNVTIDPGAAAGGTGSGPGSGSTTTTTNTTPAAVYGCIYAPDSEVHHHNGGTSYGGVISSLLCFRQTSNGHADISLDYTSGTGGVISVVR